MATVNVTRSSMPSFEEYCEEIRGIWDSRILTNMGPEHKKLEAGLKEYLGTPCVTLYTNGHLALENVIEALGLKGEIITTPFTFASTTNAIIRCGCTPVFCDINADDFTIDVSKIEALITDKTCAIMPVHVYGNLCDTDAIAAIAEKHGLKVIYDAAHAMAVTRNGVSSACFGDVAMYSFHATKAFHTVEGGALCYSDPALSKVFDTMKNFGISEGRNVACGGNAKMSEFHAAMGVCNLRHLDEEIAKRKAAAERYFEKLDGIPGIRLNKVPDGVKSNYAYFPVIFDGYKYNRDEIFDLLSAEGIVPRKYFYPATNDFECEPYCSLDHGDTPVSTYVSQHVLCLPMFADLELETVDRICSIITR